MIYALHGFLGLPEDWNILEHPHRAIDLYKTHRQDLGGWAREFNRTVQEPHPILIGYSLGGRLAMHALLDTPGKWKAAVLISAHPGMPSETERQARILHDQKWAGRFAAEPWDELLAAWNGQESLKYSAALVCKESAFRRNNLHNCLTIWSLGRQEPLKEQLEALNIPILWIAGEQDRSHAAIANGISPAHPLSKVQITPGCGHRVPWDNPRLFNQILHTFLKELPHA
jgi:2-succinyl-6-hydroxy-2,4-cyclohexadiene-1-carboxylate synthase